MNFTTEKTIRIHSLLGQSAEARLWYFLRALDLMGRGKIAFKLDWAAKVLGISVGHIRKLLRKGRGKYFHKAYERKNLMTVHLRSRDNVTRALGLDGWGTTAEVTLEEFLREGFAAIAIRAETQRLQQASYRLAKKSRKQAGRGRDLPDSDTLLSLEKATCFNGKASRRVLPQGVNDVDGKRIYLGPSFDHYGVSQERIGLGIGYCERTVHTKLQDVPRKQLMQYSPEVALARDELLHCKQEEVPVTLNGARLKVTYGRFRRHKDTPYLKRCCLYDLDLTLKSERYARRKFARSLATYRTGSPTTDTTRQPA